MGFHEDEAKLIDKRLEDGLTSTGKDEDLVSFGRDSKNLHACRVVAFVFVLVMGISLLGRLAYQRYHSGSGAVSGDFGSYYEFEIFQHDNDLKQNQPHHKARDQPQQKIRPSISYFKWSNSYDPPPRSEKAKTARYIVHNSIWASISTISVALNGAPFGMVTSFSDGTIDNSTGIPYFYLAATDPTVTNMKVNNWASLSLSEAQSDYCKDHHWDPEEPLCSRVSLTGMLVHVGPDEIKFAQKALFSRHPVMKTWPKDHDWQTLKLEITNVWLQDYYGSADIIPVEDYLKAKL